MTNELAKLLDTEVAARFGRPTDRADFALYWDGDGTGQMAWVWNDPAVDVDPSDPIPDNVAEALWLAHLLEQCGEVKDAVEFWPQMNGTWYARVGNNKEVCGATALSALARAMLAVPVEVKP